LELGNGDKFLFDVGTGSMVNVVALMIPYAMKADRWQDAEEAQRDLVDAFKKAYMK